MSASQSRNRKTKRAQPPARTAPIAAPSRKRRLRSKYVIIGSVGTLFAGLCVYGVIRDRDRDRTCVDADNYVVIDQECERGTSGARWYYGGTNNGGRMSGGSFERGGFGGHGGGGG
jgi:hypothetical protein